MLTRRHLVLTAPTVPLTTAARAAEQPDPVAFVKALCADATKWTRGSPVIPMSPAILELEQRLRDSPHRLAGPILNWVFGPGILPNTEVDVGDFRLLKRSENYAAVEAVLFIRKQRNVHRFNLIWDDGRWKIDNVFYADDDMVSWLKGQIRKSR